MRRLTSSFLCTAWALSLFGVRETALLACPPCGRAGAAGAALDGVTAGFRRTLGPTLDEVFSAGDSLQRDLVDQAWDRLPSDALAPAGWLAAGADTAGLWVRTAGRYLTPGPAVRLAWRELANKLEVYLLVRAVADRIGVPPSGEPFDLRELVRRSYALGEYPALWAVEGLGHAWVEREWHGGELPARPFLAGAAGGEVPRESLTMLHAGLGLAFAQTLLATLAPGADDRALRSTVERMIRLCRESSRRGYENAALESLGLVTRTFHPSWVLAVDRALGGDPVARDCFWHGVGRAIYFLPINFLPVGRTTWRPFEMGNREAPDGRSRYNVLAGLGWAFALVNMRQPEIVSRLLLARHGEQLAAGPGFRNGVASTVMMRRDTSPGGVLTDGFLGHRPRSAGARWWHPLVREPAERALAEIYPGLVRRQALGEIFRYRSFDELARGGEERR